MEEWRGEEWNRVMVSEGGGEGGCGVMEGGKQCWVFTNCHLAFIGGCSVAFICGQLSGQSSPFMSCCLCLQVVGGHI